MKALRRKGIGRRLYEYILQMHPGAWTVVENGEEVMGKIRMFRGVKQSNQVSPYLFNFVIDELITKLETGTAGINIDNWNSLTVQAYSDDIMLFAETESK